MRHCVPCWALILYFLLGGFPSRGMAQESADLSFRNWELADGSVRARLVHVGRRTVQLRQLADPKPISVSLVDLNEVDRAYAESHRDRFAAFALTEEVEPWPHRVADPAGISFQRKGMQGGFHTYETDHFRFQSDVELADSLFRAYSPIFEQTYQLLHSLPLNTVTPAANGKFAVRLFGEHRDYLAAGGPPGSGGVYLGQTRQIAVPLSSLGVRIKGARVAFNRDTFDSSTLEHEIAHQLMHDWLPIFPVWFTEGMAEYVAWVPRSSQGFLLSDRSGVREYLERNSEVQKRSDGTLVADMVPLSSLMGLDDEKWKLALANRSGAQLNYRSSFLAVYFLLHLDGATGSRDVVRYFQQGRSSLLEQQDMFGEWNAAAESWNQTRAAYDGKIKEFNQAVHIYNGRIRAYQYQVKTGVPANERVVLGEKPVPPPQPVMPKILQETIAPIDFAAVEHDSSKRFLIRGRSADELWEAMVSAFAKEKIVLQPVAPSSGL